MAKKKFTPIIGDLENLTQDQRQDYVLAACEFLDVPAELGLVSLKFMDGGEGKRNLVLYVEKGATDIIRNNRSISVSDMVEVNGPGYVGWKVSGKDKNGRQEIAIGTVSIQSKTGKELADSVMIAQTKACRRMTLQFAGGGFLDVTELGDRTDTPALNSATIVSSRAAQPTVVPSAAKGADITPAPAAPSPATLSEPLTGTQDTGTIPAAAQEAPKRRRGRRKSVSIDTPDKIEKTAETKSSTVSSVPQTSPAAVGAVLAVPECLGGDHQICTDRVLAEIAATKATPVATTPVSVEHPAAPPLEAKPAPAPEVPSDGGAVPTAEEKKKFRDKLSEYTNTILPEGGFLQSEKLGSRSSKMSLFIRIMFPKVNTKVLSVEQWNHLFNFFESRIKTDGVKGLVKIMHEQIGEIDCEKAPTSESQKTA